MVREFDERNMARSRERCAAMAEAANTGKRRLTERERAILDMWPRFEDTGDPVMVGDAYIDGSGDCNIIVAVRICDVCVDLVGKDGFLTGFKPGERVKRPAPEVLDADGVEIKVGDTVYGVGRSQHSFDVIDPHHIDQEVGEAFSVRCYDRDEGEECHCRPELLTHTRPDSWEQPEEDIAKYPCRYAEEVKGSKFNSCSECPWHSEVMARDIVRRAKALVGVEVGE